MLLEMLAETWISTHLAANVTKLVSMLQRECSADDDSAASTGEELGT